MLLGCKSYAFVWLFYKLDVVAFVGVVVSVFVLAKVLQQVLLVFFTSLNADRLRWLWAMSI